MDKVLATESKWCIFQARIPEWVATSYSRESPRLRDQTRVFCLIALAGGFLTWEPTDEKLL